MSCELAQLTDQRNFNAEFLPPTMRTSATNRNQLRPNKAYGFYRLAITELLPTTTICF